MKHIVYALFGLLAFAALSGCESMGFNEHAVDEALTPNVDAETTVRTWKTDKSGNVTSQEKVIQNPPAFQ